jgi:signal transduction histidine kinase/CheY-like chemotaxis protein
MFKTVEQRNLALFGAVLVVLLANAIVSNIVARTFVANDERVKRTYEVLDELDELVSALTDAETGQRGYLLTGDVSYLEPYRAAVPEVDLHYAKLSSLTEGSTPQQRILPLLKQKIDAKLAELADTIAIRDAQGFDAAQKLILTNHGKASMDDIRQITSAMESYENGLLEQREAESRAGAVRANVTLAAIALLAILMLGLYYTQTRRGIAERTQLLAAERLARSEAEAAFEAEQRARSEADSANRLKDEFLATVSHELRTPLNAMLGWSRMLRSGRLDEKTSAHALETIERNAKSQAQLVEDLLDISRIVSGRLRLDVAPVEIAPVVAAAIDVVRPTAESRSIRLRSVLDPAAGTVSGDAERLQQVVWNLLSNAVKFTPKGGKVEVRLERVNSHVEIVVSDTGRGIPPEFMPHLFELFRQGDGSMTRSYDGLGIGLAITRRIVDLHGGAIRVESAGEGRGTTFTVELPLRGVRALERPASDTLAREHPTASTPVPFDDLPDLDGLRVLAVDDQPDTLAMVSLALGECGATVRTATTAAAGFEELRAWRPDLLISDIGMPGEDGYALIAKVRALTPDEGGETPAVALSAYARVEDRMRTLSAGYQMHVPKPVEPAELVAIVASLAMRSGQPGAQRTGNSRG